jgi:hypothetical protein
MILDNTAQDIPPRKGRPGNLKPGLPKSGGASNPAEGAFLEIFENGDQKAIAAHAAAADVQ